MDARSEIREFLTSRRARLSPEQAGLPAEGGKRRVPGLRRAEVAMLAGVSTEYYTQIERGNVGGVSDSVLEALVRALRLDEIERAHLLNLVDAMKTATLRRRPVTPLEVPTHIHHLLDAITAPALLHNGPRELLAANPPGWALFSPVLERADQPVNHARVLFLDPRAQSFYVDWEHMTELAVALMRAEVGRTPDDESLAGLIDELAAGSERFRTLWAAHEVRSEGYPTPVRLHHPDVGVMNLTWEALALIEYPGWTIGVFTPTPGSASAERIRALTRRASGTLVA